jgi:hypothetical protein
VDGQSVSWEPSGWSQGPTDSQILDGGGWDARYARVLRRAVHRRSALVVVDSNGDGAELEAEAWQYESGRWEPGHSTGIGALCTTGSESSGRSGWVVWAAGWLEPGTIVTARYRHANHRVVVGATGLWTWVQDDGDRAADTDDWPEIATQPPRRDGRITLLFRSEVGADSPLWGDDIEEGHDYLVEIADLPLSAGLARELTEWAQVGWESDDPQITRQGRELCAACAKELGAGHHVEWDPRNNL